MSPANCSLADNHPSPNAHVENGPWLRHAQDDSAFNHCFPPPPLVVGAIYPPPPAQAPGWVWQSFPFATPLVQPGQILEDRHHSVEPTCSVAHKPWRRGYYSRQDAPSAMGYPGLQASPAAPSSNYAQDGSATESDIEHGPSAQSAHEDISLTVPSPDYTTDGYSTGEASSEHLHHSHTGDSSTSIRVPSSAYSTSGSSNGGADSLPVPPSSIGPAPSYRNGPPSYQYRTGPTSYRGDRGPSVHMPSGYAGYGSLARPCGEKRQD